MPETRSQRVTNGDDGEIRMQCSTDADIDDEVTRPTTPSTRQRNLTTQDNCLLRPPSQFRPGTNVAIWLQRLEDFFWDNGVSNNRKVTVAKSFLSDEVYCAVEEAGHGRGTSYDRFTQFMRLRYGDDDSITERYLAYRRRIQRDQEPILEYADAIRQLASKANITEDHLRKDHFITGLVNATVMNELLYRAPTTFDDAVQLARAMERRQPANPHFGRNQQAINRRGDQNGHRGGSGSGPNGTRQLTCWNCGQSGHLRQHCRTRPDDRPSHRVRQVDHVEPVDENSEALNC